jgi:hypothetical protein
MPMALLKSSFSLTTVEMVLLEDSPSANYQNSGTQLDFLDGV